MYLHFWLQLPSNRESDFFALFLKYSSPNFLGIDPALLNCNKRTHLAPHTVRSGRRVVLRPPRASGRGAGRRCGTWRRRCRTPERRAGNQWDLGEKTATLQSTHIQSV